MKYANKLEVVYDVATHGGRGVLLAIGFVVLGVALSGCTGTIAHGKALTLMEQGQSKTYAEGYEDGCNAGYVAAGHPYASFKRNASRYNGEPEYRNGWNDGRMTCMNQYLAVRNSR